jgi:hypothetical protein
LTNQIRTFELEFWKAVEEVSAWLTNYVKEKKQQFPNRKQYYSAIKEESPLFLNLAMKMFDEPTDCTDLLLQFVKDNCASANKFETVARPVLKGIKFKE